MVAGQSSHCLENICHATTKTDSIILDERAVASYCILSGDVLTVLESEELVLCVASNETISKLTIFRKLQAYPIEWHYSNLQRHGHAEEYM